MNRLFNLLCALAWCAVFAWAGTIFYLSTLTGHQVEQLLPMKIWDKALHFAAFGGGALILAAALRITTGRSWWVLIPLTILIVSAYGWSDEWHQQFTPGRSALDLGDWTADTLGAAAGALMCGVCVQGGGRRRAVAA